MQNADTGLKPEIEDSGAEAMSVPHINIKCKYIAMEKLCRSKQRSDVYCITTPSNIHRAARRTCSMKSDNIRELQQRRFCARLVIASLPRHIPTTLGSIAKLCLWQIIKLDRRKNDWDQNLLTKTASTTTSMGLYSGGTTRHRRRCMHGSIDHLLGQQIFFGTFATEVLLGLKTVSARADTDDQMLLGKLP